MVSSPSRRGRKRSRELRIESLSCPETLPSLPSGESRRAWSMMRRHSSGVKAAGKVCTVLSTSVASSSCSGSAVARSLAARLSVASAACSLRSAASSSSGSPSGAARSARPPL